MLTVFVTAHLQKNLNEHEVKNGHTIQNFKTKNFFPWVIVDPWKVYARAKKGRRHTQAHKTPSPSAPAKFQGKLKIILFAKKQLLCSNTPTAQHKPRKELTIPSLPRSSQLEYLFDTSSGNTWPDPVDRPAGCAHTKFGVAPVLCVLAGNFGEVFNLANWRFSGKSPNLNLAKFNALQSFLLYGILWPVDDWVIIIINYSMIVPICR